VAGLSVDPANESALVDNLVNLLARGAEWEQMSAAARRRYAEHFTGSHFQTRLLSALAQLH
jgi:glycosyltransferase involved in cell wall biosynthesis